MYSEPPVLRPEPLLRGLAKRSWEEMVHSEQEKERAACKLRHGWWWAVWEDGKLRIKRQLTGPAGTAFGGEHTGGTSATLGKPVVEYDGAAITATGLSDNDPAFDETADIVVELAKFLKERSQESGWTCVAVGSDPETARKLEGKLLADPGAPAVFDAEMASAIERSRGGCG